MQLIIGIPEILERPDSYDYHPQTGWELSGSQRTSVPLSHRLLLVPPHVLWLLLSFTAPQQQLWRAR